MLPFIPIAGDDLLIGAGFSLAAGLAAWPWVRGRLGGQPRAGSLRKAVEAMPEGLAFLDRRGRYVVWNGRYAELAFKRTGLIRPGTSFEAVLRAGIAQGLYPEAEGREEAWLADRLAHQRSEHSTHEQPLDDGRWLRIEERRTEDGGTLATLVDITELKQREASFRLLFDSNPVPMCVFAEGDFAILAVNEAAIRQYGFSREALLGRRMLDLMLPEEQPALLELCAPGAPPEYDGQASWRNVTADGREIRVMPHLQALTYQGRAARLAALWDVTARDQAEAELRRTQQFLDTVVESMPAMLLVKDLREHRYILLNRAGEELMGWRREDVLGRSVHEVFSAEEAESVAARDREVLEPGSATLVSESPVTTTNRGVRQVRTTRIAMPNPRGQPQHMIAIVEDVTERRAYETALAQARDAAEAANLAKSEFLANMSHEIRTPLNGVMGVVGVLARTELDEGQREMVDIIGSSASLLEALLSDILDLARVESGKLQIEEQPFALGEAVRTTAALCRLKADEKGLAFHVRVDSAAERQVIGDALRLKQILTNLLSNAVKFTEAGEVALAVTPDPAEPESYLFEVRDTGVGFTAEAKARLFKRFQQADGSITRRFGGTGLGLAISRSLAELMGGVLDAQSEPGRGATFSLRLPLAAAAVPAEAAPSASAPAPSTPAGQVLKVLLAEDHEVNRRVVQLILADTGVELTCVENGREAIEAARVQAFDLILMDMQMPVVGGLSAIQTIREEEAATGRPRTPILVLSANATAEHVEASARAGADGHISKPIKADILIKAVLSAGTAESEAPEAVALSA